LRSRLLWQIAALIQNEPALSATAALARFFTLKAAAATTTATAAEILIDRTGGMHCRNGVSPRNAFVALLCVLQP